MSPVGSVTDFEVLKSRFIWKKGQNKKPLLAPLLPRPHAHWYELKSSRFYIEAQKNNDFIIENFY